MRFKQVAIVGVGFIGGSLGCALKKKECARRIVGISRSRQTLRRAAEKGAIDAGSTEFSDFLQQSDLIIIATPPDAVISTAEKIVRATHHSFLLTDVTSTKKEIVEVLEKKLPPRILFAGSHPMTGSEQSGVEAASSTLFEGACCVVTKSQRTPARAISQISSLWKGIGGHVVLMSASLHDQLVAQISHLPHLAAAALVRTASPAALELAAGGFADMTRIALGDPVLWTQICDSNQAAIAASLDRLCLELKAMRRLVTAGRQGALRSALAAAQKKRQSLVR